MRRRETSEESAARYLRLRNGVAWSEWKKQPKRRRRVKKAIAPSVSQLRALAWCHSHLARVSFAIDSVDVVVTLGVSRLSCTAMTLREAVQDLMRLEKR